MVSDNLPGVLGTVVARVVPMLWVGFLVAMVVGIPVLVVAGCRWVWGCGREHAG